MAVSTEVAAAIFAFGNGQTSRLPLPSVLKVSFIDMSDLTGIYRALSFLGLGAVLIVIGWFYQRLLFPRGLESAQGEAPAEG